MTKNNKVIINLLAITVLLVGATVLTGWIFDISILKSLNPNWVTMKANTALGFLLCGIVLICYDKWKNVSKILSLFIAFIGFTVLIEYFFNIDLSIDQFIFKEEANTFGTVAPGRMAFISAIDFCLLGISFFISLCHNEKDRDKFKIHISQVLVNLSFFIALFSFYVYILCSGNYYNFFLSKYTLMAFHTAVAFILIAICFYLLTPETGVASIVFGTASGSVLARYLTIPLFFILPVIFYFLELGENIGFFNSGFGAVIMLSTVTIIINLLIIFVAKKINKIDEEKEKQSAELQIAKEKAEESDRLKSSFLQNMSHEIRTPLNGILGFSELLQTEDISKEDIKNFTGMIKLSGNRLLETVNAILDISRIESEQLTVKNKDVSIKVILSNLHSLFTIIAKDKNLEFNYIYEFNDYEEYIYTDEFRLNQILTNMINNAIKFTDTGRVEFGCKLKGNNLEFYVQDTGIGISEENQKIIFNRFVQVNRGLSRTYEGNGLGLAISKGLANLLRGNIWVESEVGKGSTFYLSLPVK